MLRCMFRQLSLSSSRVSLFHKRCLCSDFRRKHVFWDKNIFIMGPPGAGKTTVGRMVAHRMGLPAVDVDDDVLEPTWQMPVSEKLASLGGRRFLEEEGRAMRRFFATGCVVSLSGSTPLDTLAMHHIRHSGVVVYLDVDSEDIINRLARMKVNRIVGQEEGIPMINILRDRKRFYEQWIDIRVLCGRGETVTEIANKVFETLERYNNTDTYISTRSNDTSQKTYFHDVVVDGLAKDGGLYVPQNGFQKLEPCEWVRLVDKSYQERALVLLEKCIHPREICPLDLKVMVSRAYGSNFADEGIAPVKHLAGNQYIQELFHGPTASFKDLALQLMPQLFAHCLPSMVNCLILVATSGDTGSAVLSGFSALDEAHRSKTGVLVFFPEDGVSEIQKRQMVSEYKGNVRAIGVQAFFDFCQRSIKCMFGEAGLTGHLAVEYATLLSTANSINWARLLPQVVYHASSYLDLCRSGVISFGEPADVCIPTGNFGNAMSALYAKQMGVPIRKVICASNQNRVINDFIHSGVYDLRQRPMHHTHSPAIDILKSSNLERLIHLLSDGDSHLVTETFTALNKQGCFSVPEQLHKRIQEQVSAGWCSERDCLLTIRDVHRQTGYVMDTHTAVAKAVADRLGDSSVPMVICSTAHYAKFAPAVSQAIGIQHLPLEPSEHLKLLKEMSGVVKSPGAHKELMKCLEENSQRGHLSCNANLGVMVEQVENMVRDSFLKAP